MAAAYVGPGGSRRGCSGRSCRAGPRLRLLRPFADWRRHVALVRWRDISWSLKCHLHRPPGCALLSCRYRSRHQDVQFRDPAPRRVPVTARRRFLCFAGEVERRCAHSSVIQFRPFVGFGRATSAVPPLAVIPFRCLSTPRCADRATSASPRMVNSTEAIRRIAREPDNRVKTDGAVGSASREGAEHHARIVARSTASAAAGVRARS